MHVCATAGQLMLGQQGRGPQNHSGTSRSSQQRHAPAEPYQQPPQELQQGDGSQTGQGRCIITGKDGSVFGQLTCTGFQFVGCSGDFTITGGTGRFSGITGSGKAVVRSESRSTGATKSADGSLTEDARGIIYWQELEYKIP